MKKLFAITAFLLVVVLSANLMADPIQTTEDFWAAIFDDGDLKLAFSQIATEDQDYIKTNAPDVYNFIMGDIGDLGDDFAGIFLAFQKVILNTLGKVMKVENVNLGDRTDEGQEVNYSLTFATDVESYMKLVKWVKSKQGEFDNPEDSIPMMDKISEFINDLSQRLNDISFKTSVSPNSFLTIINENGQEKVFLNLAMTQEKLKWLEGLE